MKLFFCLCLVNIILGFKIALAQSTVVSDSIFHGLRVHDSTLPDVFKQLGKPSSQKEIMGVRSSKFRDGTCVTAPYLYGYALRYRKIDAMISINKKHNWVEEIRFGSSSHFVSAKGIQTRKNSFADVLATYGPVDFEKKDNNFPMLQQESDGKKWFTKLSYPGISFVSYGAKQPSENISLRRVDEIWLE